MIADGTVTGKLRRNLPWLLVAATLALFATETLFNIPYWLMAALGLYELCRAPRAVLAQPGTRLAGALFLCLWLPQLAALPDAASPARSIETALAYPHFFLAAVYLLQSVRDPVIVRRLELAVFAIISVWIIDAMIQYTLGKDLLGYPYRRGQLTGMFDPHMRLGHLLAVLLPVYLDITRRLAAARPWPWLLPALLCAVIILSGKRVAWVMAAVAMLGYGGYLLLAGALRARILAFALLFGALAGVGLLGSNEILARRAAAVLDIFSTDMDAVDKATSHRMPLWRTATEVAGEHWINGVGPRGYRFVFRDFADEDNFYLRDGRDGSTHPHLPVLEIAAETGLIGLAGLFAFWWILATRVWRRHGSRPGAMPWLISVFVAWLPINAHLAFYGSYWSSVSWWVLSLLLVQPEAGRNDSQCPGS
ncbi:MAG: O-antigen ligase family protein [Gammaproteobacteria bacterium]|nr:O-antigen ligase family protein [Gammaproteobacteria bacterium]